MRIQRTIMTAILATISVTVLAACNNDQQTAKPDAHLLGGGSGEPEDLAGITAAHNQARTVVGDPALVWDPALATIAATWVAMCVDSNGDGLVDHNPNRSVGYPTYVGENIYASSGTADAMDAVTDWVAEQQYYTYATNSCAAGQVCGHYTQVVWKDTMKLGCALYDCTGLTYPSTIVCDYGPGGNIDGQSPY